MWLRQAPGGGTSGLSDAGGAEAFRWTGQEGMVGLGDLPGGRFESNAKGVSGDGRVIVGASHATTNNGEGHIAFIWTEEWGMRSLADVLINDLGLDLSGWYLDDVEAISADGTTIVGTGYHTDGSHEGWIAVISELTPQSDADFDSDGDVDGTDFLLWQAGYPTSTGATHMLGDADYDGDVDGIDFLLWQRNYPYPAALSSVPEPNSLVLLALGGLVALRRRTAR